MITEADRARWREYLAVTRDRPAHPIFDLLDEYLPSEGHAIDLGCGAGRGTLRLLERGLRVTATDVSGEAIDIVRERLPAGAPVELIRASFAELSLRTYDVAVACFSLFFQRPPAYEAFWPRLVEAIRPGGLFAGQFLGVNDSWAAQGMTAHTRAEVTRLLGPFEILSLTEEEQDGETAIGEQKHWHVFHVIARKR